MIGEWIHRTSTRDGSGQDGLERVKRLGYSAGGAALVIAGLRRKGMGGAALALAGSDLIYRGLSGEDPFQEVFGKWRNGGTHELPYGRGVKLKESVIVRKPAKELYRIWRDFEVLPAFMPDLASVETLDDRRSRWAIKAPAGTAIEWDAEVIADREGKMIGWRSVNGGVVAHAGSVRFEGLRGGRTRVAIAMQYNPLGGEAGAAVARVFGSDPKTSIHEALERFRDFAESVDLGIVNKLLRRAPVRSKR